MYSSPARARSRRAPLGVESTGLPANVTRARMRPFPGVSISSASAAAGSSPPNSGRPRTRLRQRSKWPRSPVLDASATRSAAGVANMNPPSRSRFPVTALSATISQAESPPNSCVQVPTRPYATAAGAEANSRASSRMADAPLLEKDVQQGEQEERIASGADGQMLVRRRGGLGAARVDHHQLAAAFAQVVEPARDATRRHQAAVRSQRIRAQHQEETGPIDVGDRQQHLMAEHLQGGKHVRQLVDRGGRKARPRSQRPVEERRRQERGVGVHSGVAQVHPDGAPAVLALHFGETRPCLVERRLPGDRLPPAAFAPLRRADAVWIVLHVDDGGRLRADVSPAEGIIGVAADATCGIALDFDREAAHRLAEHAGMEVSRHRETRGNLACGRHSRTAASGASTGAVLASAALRVRSSREVYKIMVRLLVSLSMIGLALPAFAADTLKLAITGPFTGGSAPMGASMRDGAKLAIGEINAAGGIAVGAVKMKIEVIERDDEAKNERGALIAQELASMPDLSGVIGSVNTGVVMAGDRHLQEKGITKIITPAAGSASMTQWVGKVKELPIFRFAAHDGIQSAMVVEEAINRKFTKVAIFHDATLVNFRLIASS